MRWNEITEKLQHAMPLRARYSANGQPDTTKAQPLIAPPPTMPDPTVAIAQGLAQGIAPVVQGAISNAVAVDDQEEQSIQARAIQQAQQVAQVQAQKAQEEPELEALRRLAKTKQ